MEFPLGVFGIALATATLPSMSAQAARRRVHRAALPPLEFALRLSAFVAVPATVGLLLLGGPIVQAALPARASSAAADAALTAQALAGYAVGLPAFSATRIAAQTFYALGDTRTPVLVGFVSVAVNVVLALVLMWPLRHTGLALASSLSSYVNVIGLCWLLQRRLGGPRGAEIWGSLGRTVVATAALALWCAWVEGFLPVVPEPVRARARADGAGAGGRRGGVRGDGGGDPRAGAARAARHAAHAPLNLAQPPGAGDRLAHAPGRSQGTPRSWPGSDASANAGAVAFWASHSGCDPCALGSERPRSGGPRESSPKPRR